MCAKGHSLIELLIVIAVICILAAVAVPGIRAYLVDARLLGAGEAFKGHFREVYSIAIRSNVQTAIRFEQWEGQYFYSLYVDGNHNGVLSQEIAAGVDSRIRGPMPLNADAPGVFVGIHPGTPAPPPDSGWLDTSRPIRFGRSNMISFSPLGTATPGTFYLANESGQVAVRVTPGSARVRLMVFRGGKWRVR